MRECSSCQAANDDKSAFCLECGQKLAPIGRQSGSEDAGGGRQRLHSPILGGYEDVDDNPRRPAEKARPAAPKGGKPAAHLRSPLLGGSDEGDDYDEQPQVRPAKGKGLPGKAGGKMRSPLLGGAPGAVDDDYEEDFPFRDRNDDRSPFPHRSRPREVDESSAQAQPHPAPGGGKHLRSPLLGGADDDYEDDSYQQNPQQSRNAGSSGRPQKLHSPIFDRQGGGGGFNDFDYDDDDDAGEIDDPSVLRSPLLAAKSRVPLDNRPKQPPGNQPPNQPGQPQFNQQPQQPQQPQLPPPQGFPQPGVQPGYGNQPSPGYPQSANPGQFPQPGFAPPAPPQPAAAFSAPPSPPFNSPPLPAQPGFAQPTTSAPTGASQGSGYEFGAPSAPMGNSGSLFLTPPAPVAQPAPVEPLRPQLPTDVGPSTASGAGSPVFAGMPLDAKVRRDMSATIQESAIDASAIEKSVVDAPAPAAAKNKLKGGRFGTPPVEPTDDFDDEPQAPATRKGSIPGRRFDSSSDSNYSVGAHSSSGAPSGPIMVIFITAFLAGIAKLWYFATFFQSFMGNMAMLADQVGQIAIIVGLIIFAMKGTQK